MDEMGHSDGTAEKHWNQADNSSVDTEELLQSHTVDSSSRLFTISIERDATEQDLVQLVDLIEANYQNFEVRLDNGTVVVEEDD